MESQRKKVVVRDEEEGNSDGGESSVSVVLQCTESEAVEEGEEVAMVKWTPRREKELPYPGRDGSLTVAEAKLGAHVLKKKREGESESKEVVSVDRSFGDKKIILTPRMVGGYWRTGVRRRCRGRKSFMHGPFGVGASFVVDRVVGIKRTHEEVKQCRPVAFDADESNESDDSASSSDSDASDSESEQRKRRKDTVQLRSGERKQPSFMAQGMQEEEEEEEEAAAADCELKEMQHLLELQLKAAEKREAGMKQRMERMMDALSQHMGHVEKRVCNFEEGTQPQEQVLERINVKLEKVMEGFSTLNENLAVLSACLSKNLDP